MASIISFPDLQQTSQAQAVEPGASQCAFGVVGLSYRTAPLELRGRIGFDKVAARSFLAEVREHWVDECMILSTCNRTEIYFTGANESGFVKLLAERAGVRIDELQPHLYIKRGLDAASHIFRVASGLDSNVLGETEIVAQIKLAWQMAQEERMSGTALGLILQRSMIVSKRVRTETDLCRGVTSTASLAIQTASRRLSTLAGKRVLVLGAGQIAERLVKELSACSPSTLKVLSRSEESACRLATTYDAIGGPLSNLDSAIKEADVVFTALSTPDPVITDATVTGTTKLLIVDLGVPANVRLSQPHLGIENVHIDSLSAECAENSRRRTEAVPAAVEILDAELSRLNAELISRSASPTIKALVDQAEGIRSLNLDWAMAKLDGLNDRERKVVEDLTIRIIKGLLQAPIEGLKGELATRGHREVVSRLFQLGG